jgi:hypothetical protein
VRLAGVVLALSLGVPLVGCTARTPSETVVLSPPKISAFGVDAPDGRWQKAHPSRPKAMLFGRGATTKSLLSGRAVLEASCVRRKPRARVAFHVSLGRGNFTVTYRFDAKPERTGVTNVRGSSRNLVTIDYPVTAQAFLTELGASSTLKVKLRRLPYDWHEADFRWDRADPVLKELLAACHASAPRKDRPEVATDDADDDDPLDKAIKVAPEDE